MSKHIFSVEGARTLLDGAPFQSIGLRCSNGLYSDKATDGLVANLGIYASYGVNSIGVYVMGNRYSDMRGYREDATLDPVYVGRMARIVEEADKHGIVVLVGCLYWADTKGKWESWRQGDAETAVRNTMAWLAENDYRNTFLDTDNEGMGIRRGGFDERRLIVAAKTVDPRIPVASNFVGAPPEEADLCIHHSDRAPGKPYMETEAVAESAPGGYFGRWSKKVDVENRHRYDMTHWNYINIGVYTEEMKENQQWLTADYLDRGDGYHFSSTWLQAADPPGPQHGPGGQGGPDDPGMRWWLEFIQEREGAYTPPGGGA